MIQCNLEAGGATRDCFQLCSINFLEPSVPWFIHLPNERKDVCQRQVKKNHICSKPLK